MTKQQEIQMIRKFIEGLPQDSYLAKILKGADGHIENMIRNDFAYSLISELRAAQQNAK